MSVSKNDWTVSLDEDQRDTLQLGRRPPAVDEDIASAYQAQEDTDEESDNAFFHPDDY